MSGEITKDRNGIHRCQLCNREADNGCGEFHREMWICTKVKGHTGNHAACGVCPDEHPIFEWEQEGGKDGDN